MKIRYMKDKVKRQSILSITVLIAFILRRLYIIHFSIKLSPFFLWSYIYIKIKF